MNRVGHAGRGESVWLGWFLVTVLNDFAPLCDRHGRGDLGHVYREEARWLTGMLELAWDGDWYRRAYFDDGTPLGSVQNEECRLDSITQSWAVISGAAQPNRAERAMNAVRAHLVRRDAQIVLMLTPTFDRMAHDPGYIKGYLPGVRENGAQYTHAALWAVLATALRGDGDRAFEWFQMINPLTHARRRLSIEQHVRRQLTRLQRRHRRHVQTRRQHRIATRVRRTARSSGHLRVRDVRRDQLHPPPLRTQSARRYRQRPEQAHALTHPQRSRMLVRSCM
jgi:cellobiose phosphorylase